MYSEFGPFPTGVFGVTFHVVTLSSLSIFLFHDPLFVLSVAVCLETTLFLNSLLKESWLAFHAHVSNLRCLLLTFFLYTFVFIALPILFSCLLLRHAFSVHVIVWTTFFFIWRVIFTFSLCLDRLEDCLLGLIMDFLWITCCQMEEILPSLVTVREIDNQTTNEAILHGSSCDHFDLLWATRIELECTSSTFDKASVERWEEMVQSFPWVLARLFSRAKPLNCRDRDRSIECSMSEAEAMSHIRMQHVSFNFSLTSHLKHGFTDIGANPHVTFRTDYTSRDTWPTAYIKNELWLPLGNGKEFKRSLRHLLLDVDHSCIDGILARFFLVVEDISRRYLFRSVLRHSVMTILFIKYRTLARQF